MRKFDRWVTKHYTVISRATSLLWAGFAVAGIMVWRWHILWALLAYFVGNIVTALLLARCGDRLRREAIASANQNCDPYPLLEEMRTQLHYSLPPMQMLMTEINYALALEHTGEYQQAYQRLNDINIAHPRISPNVRLVYYSNRADLCFMMGKYEEVITCHEKAVHSLENMKPGKSKETLRSLVESNYGMHHFCKEEYDAALQALEQAKPRHLSDRVSNAFTAARTFLALGEKENAIEKLQFVVENGNQMYVVTVAKDLLAEINGKE